MNAPLFPTSLTPAEAARRHEAARQRALELRRAAINDAIDTIGRALARGFRELKAWLWLSAARASARHRQLEA